jgi:AcrR family transcriptional regulator
MTTDKRPYLRADDRRRQLLDAARQLFAKEGFAGLTMVSLASEAGVSRRLVYDHFADTAELFHAVFDDRAAAYRAAIDAAFVSGGGDLTGSVTAVFRGMLDIPVDDQRAIRTLFAGTGPAGLDPIREQLHDQTVQRWLPLLRADLPLPVGRAIVWTLANAMFSLSELVHRGDIGPDQAEAVLAALVTDLPVRTAAAITVCQPV